MAKKFKDHSLAQYAALLSAKQPVPGGGSAAAYTGVLGVSLLLMVANYSLGKNKISPAKEVLQKTIKRSNTIAQRLLDLVDLDAQTYLKYVKARQAKSPGLAAALKATREVPLKICRSCYEAIQLAPDLVRYGNPSLLSDVEVGSELLLASFKGALVLSNL